MNFLRHHQIKISRKPNAYDQTLSIGSTRFLWEYIGSQTGFMGFFSI